MSAGTLILMTIVLTIPMFLRGRIGIDKLLNLETRFDDSPCDDSACDDSDFCNGGKCVNACYNISCHQNEVCRTSNHISSCECVPNFKRNNKGECKKECFYDGQCEQHEHCQDDFCIDIVGEECGLNAEKIFVNHIEFCVCPRGFRGHPYDVCRKRCINDNECDDSDTCYKNLCTDACHPIIKPCAYFQKCEVKNHTANCIDEIIDTYKPCRNDSNCDVDSYCHSDASVCVPICGLYDCDDNESCTTSCNSHPDKYTSTGKVFACFCKSYFVRDDDKLKCYKSCNNDTICEENEHCDNLNHCVPRKV